MKIWVLFASWKCVLQFKIKKWFFTFIDFVNIVKRNYINLGSWKRFLVGLHRRTLNKVYNLLSSRTAAVPFQVGWVSQNNNNSRVRAPWHMIFKNVCFLIYSIKNVTKSLTWGDLLKVDTLSLLICKTSPHYHSYGKHFKSIFA